MIDDQGKESWKYPTKAENLIGKERYLEHFQHKRNGTKDDRLFPYIMIKDINSNGFLETLFSIHTTTGFGGGIVVCLDYRGKEL